MAFTYDSVVDAPIQEVFAWHGRPGAFSRLVPPWQPVTLVREAASLRDGTAIIALPGGLRWTARHLAAAYDPPFRFADELSTPVRAPFTVWRHVHSFEPYGPDATRMTDRVDTIAPVSALRSMFAYRHRQLAADLAAHRRLGPADGLPPTIAITGASGLVGSALSAFLSTGGYQVVRLVRNPPRHPGERQWNPRDPAEDLLTGVDVLIHLAGASIGGRFTDQHKVAIRDSRIGPTRRLAHAAARTVDGPHTMITASAIGWYGSDRGDEVLDEDAGPGDGFLADVVAEWEGATAPAGDAGLRVVKVRTGIVQTPAGGSLRVLRPLFWAGAGGRIGDGSQWTSWIGIDDLVDVYLRAAVDARLHGPVNAVAPEPVTNAEYTRTLAHVMRRPAVVPVPSLGPRVILGDEGARELAEADQRVVPRRLLDVGHVFRFPTLEPALRHVLGRAR